MGEADVIASLVAQVQRERRAVLVELYRRQCSGDGEDEDVRVRESSVTLLAPNRRGAAFARLHADGLIWRDFWNYSSGGERVCGLTPAGIAEVERMATARDEPSPPQPPDCGAPAARGTSDFLPCEQHSWQEIDLYQRGARCRNCGVIQAYRQEDPALVPSVTNAIVAGWTEFRIDDAFRAPAHVRLAAERVARRVIALVRGEAS